MLEIYLTSNFKLNLDAIEATVALIVSEEKYGASSTAQEEYVVTYSGVSVAVLRRLCDE